MTNDQTVLSTAIGNYRHTEALKSGRITSDKVRLEFADIPTINRAFAPMVREQRFDVCEMAIATFLQAKAWGKPLALLPVVMAARFQQSALLCRSDGEIGGPADLVGRRIGVRAYSQTTGMWLRGILADEYGVRPEQVRWITFEGAHVAEYQDPPWAERAAPGKELLPMLRAGELDAVVVGNEVPDDPSLRPVFPDAQASAEAFWRQHRLVPVNPSGNRPARLGRAASGSGRGTDAYVQGRQSHGPRARRWSRPIAHRPHGAGARDRTRLALCGRARFAATAAKSG
jgi:4,5-dihydroxyphthalate decarboxylase